jgi:hypothetical protein
VAVLIIISKEREKELDGGEKAATKPSYPEHSS